MMLFPDFAGRIRSAREAGLPWCPRSGSFSDRWPEGPNDDAAYTFGCMPRCTGLSLVGEPVVAWSVWVPVVKLPEFVQSARGEVVVRLLCQIPTFRIVEPFDEVENPAIITAPSLDARHDFLDVVLLTLLDIVGFPKYL